MINRNLRIINKYILLNPPQILIVHSLIYTLLLTQTPLYSNLYSCSYFYFFFLFEWLLYVVKFTFNCTVCLILFVVVQGLISLKQRMMVNRVDKINLVKRTTKENKCDIAVVASGKLVLLFVNFTYIQSKFINYLNRETIILK